MKLRIVLVDDREIAREGLRSLLDREPDLEVAATAAGTREALAEVRRHRPHVVLIDVSRVRLDGVEATRRIVSAMPRTRVLWLAGRSTPRLDSGAIEAGASGYLLDDCGIRELVRTIRGVGGGATRPGREVGGPDTAPRERRPVREHRAPNGLTEREAEVLRMIADGLTSAEIAQRLRLSVKTIGTHREKLMLKLDLHNVANLTRYAVREGLVRDDS